MLSNHCSCDDHLRKHAGICAGRMAVVAAIAILIAIAVLLSRAHAHDGYSDWKQPSSNISCCSDKDCHSLEDSEVKFENGHWVAWHRATKTWVVIPNDRVINEPNPNGKAHLCATETGYVWCFLPPSGGV
jgi:hypothetical protein